MDLTNILSMQESLLSRTTGPKDAPERYRGIEHPRVQYAAQANGLTSTADLGLHGRIQLLEKSDRLFESLQGIAGGTEGSATDATPPADTISEVPIPAGAEQPSDPPTLTGLAEAMAALPPPPASPVQIEGDHARVVRLGTYNPLVKTDDKGQLSGDPGVISSYATADRVHSLASDALGRDFSYAQGEKMTVALGSPLAAMKGPNQAHGQARVSLPADPNAETDPDTVSHEIGHGILDAHRPEYTASAKTLALHEAFGDGVALTTSLQDPDVRKDVITRRAAGNGSNMASNVGEGYQQTVAQQAKAEAQVARDAGAKVDPQPPVTQRDGLRDLAMKAPEGPESSFADPHAAAQQFGSGLYHNVLAVNDRLKDQDPKLSNDEALKQASGIVRRDFMRSVDFLPVGGDATQADLARAMMKADKTDNGGAWSSVYATNFDRAGIATKDDAYAAHEAQVAALGQDPSLKLPAAVAGGEAFKRNAIPEGQAPVVPTSAQVAAEQYLQAHGDRLGVPSSGMSAQEMYHNNRGETFVYYSNGQNRYDTHASEYVGLGFDKDGRLLHSSSGKTRPLPVGGVTM